MYCTDQPAPFILDKCVEHLSYQVKGGHQLSTLRNVLFYHDSGITWESQSDRLDAIDEAVTALMCEVNSTLSR
jgi:hypothetical protein